MPNKNEIITSQVMKDAYALAKSHTSHPDDVLIVAGALLNVARMIYIDTLGLENARKLFDNIVELSFTNKNKPTLH